MRPRPPFSLPFSLIRASWFTAAALALATWAGCGFSSKGGGNNQDVDASVDSPAPPIDASGIDGGSGMTCYGPAGWQVCFTSPPTGSLNLTGTINTDGGNPCAMMQPMGWGGPQPAACFIVRDTITIPGGGLIVNGGKPLVLVAKSLITVGGDLDVASHQGDMGTQPSECQPFSQSPSPSNSNSGGGGGAGGSFMTPGGSGGNGDNGNMNGKAAPADTMMPNHLRGGCLGQAGGAANSGDAGKPGSGGGSVYLLSGGIIDLQKSINASGAGGGGGNKGNDAAGGGGGGSGGMIVLYAATITVPSITVPSPALMANGGGGGGGGVGNSARGAIGSDPSLASPLVPASGGGNGGSGYAGTTAALDGTNGAGTGDGGGGGGGGAGYILLNKPLVGPVVSPAANMFP